MRHVRIASLFALGVVGNGAAGEEAAGFTGTFFS